MFTQSIMQLAIGEAKKSQHNYQLGALVLEKGKVISKGFNRHSIISNVSHIRQGVCTIHAEQIALRRTGNRRGDTLLVVRLISSGFAMAKPCKRCLKHAKRSGISHIYYSNQEGQIVREAI